MNPRLTKKLSGAWFPTTESDAEALGRYKAGDIVEFEKVRRRRNGKHHRKLFVLADLVFENQDRYPTKKALLDDLKLKAGHVETHLNYWRRPGETEWQERVIKYPKSIAYDSMDQDEFEEFYDSVVAVVLEVFYPDMSRVGLDQELLQFAANWDGTL